MPIGGFIITCSPGNLPEALEGIAAYPAVEVHGTDEEGNIVVVMDTSTSEAMDDVVKTISRLPVVLSVGLAYLNTEDEAKDATGDEA